MTEVITTKKQIVSKKSDDASSSIENSDIKQGKKTDPWSWEDFIDMLVTGKQASVTGEGSSLMVEWSTPTAVALLRTLQHLKQHYQLFVVRTSSETQGSGARDGQSAATSLDETDYEGSHVDSAATDLMQNEMSATASRTYIAKVLRRLSEVALSFHFTDANAFVYGVTPGDVCLHFHSCLHKLLLDVHVHD